MRIHNLAFALLATTGLAACASTPSANHVSGYSGAAAAAIAPRWSEAQANEILSQTRRLHLAPDPSQLSEGERAAVTELIAAGERLHLLYLSQRHPQARAAAAYLSERPELEHERVLFRLMSGPIATTLDNRREAFLDVADEAPARGVYPQGATREALDSFLDANPERRAELLDDRAVVWAATPSNRARALEALDRFPALDTLHPGLRERLRSGEAYLGVPYSVAYADDLMFVYDRLNNAAAYVESGDAAFARYLRLRARDIISDNYEAGDAAWVTGDLTGNLNAQIGSYETYDDAMYGVKTFFSLSLLMRDRERSAELSDALADIQAVEDALPYAHHREVRRDIPVGVYDIIADFGQSRGGNTATILPNTAYLARQYGRTILIRGNILLNPSRQGAVAAAFNAATTEPFHDDLTAEGGFYRTLWHEIGHYLGVDQTADGRELDAALEDTADLFEEMKADLISLTAARILNERGRMDDAQLRSIYASGVLRVLQNNRPRRDQAYGTMQLIQWNWFMQHGVLRLEDGRLAINYRRYPAAVESLLREVLALQRAGDRDAANAFVDQWTTWSPDVHDVIAENIRNAQTSRYTLVTYGVLDGPES